MLISNLIKVKWNKMVNFGILINIFVLIKVERVGFEYL